MNPILLKTGGFFFQIISSQMLFTQVHNQKIKTRTYLSIVKAFNPENQFSKYFVSKELNCWNPIMCIACVFELIHTFITLIYTIRRESMWNQWNMKENLNEEYSNSKIYYNDKGNNDIFLGCHI